MNRRTARTKTVVICLSAGLAAACWSEGLPLENTGEADSICLDPDCSDTVTVNITRRDEQIFPPGEYTFSMEIEADAPLIAACTLAEDYSLSCSGTDTVHVHINPDMDRFTVRVDDRAPEQLLTVVDYESTEIGAEILLPDYEYVGSGDPDCTLTCMQGTAAMRTVSPPA